MSSTAPESAGGAGTTEVKYVVVFSLSWIFNDAESVEKGLFKLKRIKKGIVGVRSGHHVLEHNSPVSAIMSAIADVCAGEASNGRVGFGDMQTLGTEPTPSP